MRKYNIVCPHRKPNKYKQIAKATKEHRTCSNILNRKFKQEIPRKGNCWDNAPMESFFGHMKDNIDLKNCRTLEEVKKEIKKFINYYNNHRYQWGLKKMTPVEYRNHLLAS